MRIIVLNDHGFINGGAAQVAISSLNALADAGVNVTFVSSVEPVDPSINLNLVKVINFGLPDLLSNPSRVQAAISGIWNSLSAVRFEDVLAKFDPQNTIIHLHTWTKSLSSSVVHVAIKRGFKVVCTLHDYFSICPNGGLYNYKQKQLCVLDPMSLACIASNCDARSYGQKLWRVARQVVQNNIGHIPQGIKYFITISDYSESLLRPRLPSTSKFFRVRNPIDITKINPSDVGCNQAFTFIGRLSPEKGCVLFATAAHLAGVRSVFVGCGDEEQNIRVMNPKAVFLGWQDRAGVIRAIQSSRAIVFPSLWHETQGLVVLEAAALGVPAIVSDACAATDAIVDGETGVLFRAGDSGDLSAKLKLLKNDSELSMNLGLQAYVRYWSAPCTVENHVKELIGCYTAVMEGVKCA
jgi:glycosyltransferase involved in cell wall biosynthesis